MIKIRHKRNIYNINKSKLIFILTKLSNKEIKETQIKKLMKKYNLYNKDFLGKINEI